MKNLLKFTLLLLVTTTFGCAKMDSIDFSRQKVLFEKEYINFAWGYNHTGWYIDSVGVIYYYNKPQNWNTTDSTNTIKLESLNSNLSYCRRLTITIDKSELAIRLAQMTNAAKGKLSNPVMEMADAGINSNYELLYNQETKSYKRILLKQIGDWRIENSSAEAESLWQWMRTIDERVNAEISK